jgi:hypothetical protein
MKYRYYRLLLPAILLFHLHLHAQTPDIKDKFEIEIDPVAYLLNGYSFHAIYNHNHFRFDTGIFGLEQPDALSGNKNYKAMSSGLGLKVNYLFRAGNSFYAGADIGLGKTKITADATGASDTNHDVNAGVHVGYRVFVFGKKESFLKGFYLTPWVGISYNHFYDKAKFEDYKEDKIGYFATFHVGYRF